MATKFLTEEGRERLMRELDELKQVARPSIIQRIHEAKEFGEMSEGNESDEVRNEQAFIEGRILMLERLLKDAVVISQHSSDTVSIGATVKLKSDDGEHQYTIGRTSSNKGSGSQHLRQGRCKISASILAKGKIFAFIYGRS